METKVGLKHNQLKKLIEYLLKLIISNKLKPITLIFSNTKESFKILFSTILNLEFKSSKKTKRIDKIITNLMTPNIPPRTLL